MIQPFTKAEVVNEDVPHRPRPMALAWGCWNDRVVPTLPGQEQTGSTPARQHDGAAQDQRCLSGLSARLSPVTVLDDADK